MAELRGALEGAGITVRRTYLQSGNIVFDAPRAPATMLAGRIQAAGQPKVVRPTAAVVLSARQLGRVLADVPVDCGNDNAFAHHLVFLIPPMTAVQVLGGQQFDSDMERVSSKGRIIYWSIRKDARIRCNMTRPAGADASLPAHYCSLPRTRPPALRAHEEALITKGTHTGEFGGRPPTGTHFEIEATSAFGACSAVDTRGRGRPRSGRPQAALDVGRDVRHTGH
jgi:uncharacterized protein (DUF1697 family)